MLQVERHMHKYIYTTTTTYFFLYKIMKTINLNKHIP